MDPVTHKPLPGASTVLTMGILSVVGALVCCGPFAAIFSIIGLVKARAAEKLYRADPTAYTGYESVSTGRVLSYIGLVLAGIMIILLVLYFGVIIALITSGTYEGFH